MKNLKVLLFALIMMTSCEKEDVAPQNPLEGWKGEYFRQTRFWCTFFSPLDINKDGTVTIADEDVEVTFDEATLELSFDWTNIKTTTAKAAFTFSGEYPDYVFSGSINPRQQDGPVGFSGE